MGGVMPRATLEQNIAAYERMQDQLEAEHMGQWVVVDNEQLIDAFDDFQDAANLVSEKIGLDASCDKLDGLRRGCPLRAVPAGQCRSLAAGSPAFLADDRYGTGASGRVDQSMGTGCASTRLQGLDRYGGIHCFVSGGWRMTSV